jgi:hypothetical protein
MADAARQNLHMRTFTLDTNCVIAIEECRPESAAVRALADAHAAGRAHVAIVAMSASEKQRTGSHVHNFEEFRQRLVSLGLDHLDILKPMAYFDITFLDWCLLTDGPMERLERQIHSVLFPTVEFNWHDYCSVHGLDLNTLPAGKWRNCKCDVQALWSHIHSKRNVFVTSDQNFHAATKKVALIALGANLIEYPDSAVSLI